MSEVVIKGSNGHFEIDGELSFATVTELWRDGINLFSNCDDVHIDLGGVTRSDSAGLVLLVEWMRFLKERGNKIRFSSIPQQMLDIARVSSLDNILPISHG
jgi:phospholipid transport system transporter-binding protein